MPKTTYVWDELSDNVIVEYEDGVLTVSYDHEPGLYGNLLSQNRNGVTSYYHYDGRGDTVALTDDAGNVTDTKEYDAWGNVIASTGSTVTPYQFIGRNGYQRDINTLLTYVRLRFFSVTGARWTSTDPIRYVGGTNLYAYGRQSPIMRVDPSGKMCRSDFCSKNSPHANKAQDEPDSEGTTLLSAVIETGSTCAETYMTLRLRENHSTFTKAGVFKRCGEPANDELDEVFKTGGNFQIVRYWDPMDGAIQPKCSYNNVWRKDVNGCWDIEHIMVCLAKCSEDKNSCSFPPMDFVLGAWDYGRNNNNSPQYPQETPGRVYPISAVYIAFSINARIEANCCKFPKCKAIDASFYWADRGVAWDEGDPIRQHGELPPKNCDGINVPVNPQVLK